MPSDLTPVPLPPYVPEPGPIERVWLSLRERFLSHRLLDGHDAIVNACHEAWNALAPDRLGSLCSYAWLTEVASQARGMTAAAGAPVSARCQPLEAR